MGDIVKSGYVKRYSKSFLNGGWNKSFLELHKDSHLNVYKKQGDSKCQGSIFMKEVCKYFAYGEYTSGMPDRPTLPSGSSYDCIMGIPQKPSSRAKIHWFLFSSTNELHDWMTAICSVLPPSPPQNTGTHQQQQSQPVRSNPPPASGAQPPSYGPGLGFENLSVSGGAPPPYPQVPGPAQYSPHPPYQGHHYAPQYPPQGSAPPGAYGPPPPHGAYPQQAYYPAPAPGYPQQQYYQQPAGSYQGYPQQPVVYQQQPKKKKGGFLSGNTGKMAAGLAGGALLGYGASRMMGGGWGLGRWGSWSSLSSCGSFGSVGSFGSFGSFG